MPGVPPEPLPPDLERLVQSLIELRNALEETALALSDYQFSLDSPQRDAVGRQALQMIERAKSDCNKGNGP